jgi:hypothetical protein
MAAIVGETTVAQFASIFAGIVNSDCAVSDKSYVCIDTSTIK